MVANSLVFFKDLCVIKFQEQRSKQKGKRRCEIIKKTTYATT